MATIRAERKARRRKARRRAAASRLAVHSSPKCSCSRTYQCAHCKRLCGYCFGASDDIPDVCDDCWYAAFKAGLTP